MKNQKGITLIALIITIIVMLILVGVSVTVALNGGLFSTAQKATGDTKAERDNELALSDGKVEINGEWYNSIDEYVNGNSGGAKVEILPKKGTYTIGEEVTIGEEHFFVIADDTEKVTLLAKYNLNTEGTAQSNAAYSETACAFSSTNYWSTIEGITYTYDLNDTPTSADTDAIAKARAYGAARGGTGRLMTYEEAEELVTSYEGIIYGTNINATDGYLFYWLGSAYDTDSVWSVSGGAGRLGDYYFGSGNPYGVRPVVEISKSNM